MTIEHIFLLNTQSRATIIREIQELILPTAPFFTPILPSGNKMSCQQTSCGSVGWLTQPKYHYSLINPSGNQWPEMIPSVLRMVGLLKETGKIPDSFNPETCLINKYSANSKLGLHRDEDEEDLKSPLISISLGCPATFLLGGLKRNDPIEKVILNPGDILILSGEDRMRYHGIEKIHGTKRINLTIRQVYQDF